jgi:hypothetical protein
MGDESEGPYFSLIDRIGLAIYVNCNEHRMAHFIKAYNPILYNVLHIFV